MFNISKIEGGIGLFKVEDGNRRTFLGTIEDVDSNETTNERLTIVLRNKYGSQKVTLHEKRLLSSEDSPELLKVVLERNQGFSVKYLGFVLKKLIPEYQKSRVNSENVPKPVETVRKGFFVKKSSSYVVSVQKEDIIQTKMISMRACTVPRIILSTRRDVNKKGTIFWDLDNCLLCTEKYQESNSSDYEYVVNTSKNRSPFISSYGSYSTRGVFVRPYAVEVLKECKKLKFENILFTAANERYTKAVLEEFDPGRTLFDHVLSRNSCNVIDGKFLTKNISDHNRDLETSILVDDTVMNFAFCQANGLPVKKYFGCKDDRELKAVLAVILYLFDSDDVREPLRELLHMERVVQNTKRKAIPKNLQVERFVV